MNISAIPNSKTNFNGYAPIQRVLYYGQNGVEYVMPKELQKGAIYTLVRRLNCSPNARETMFFKEVIPVFRNYPFVSSTTLGTPGRKLVFGKEDIGTLRGYCNGVYHTCKNTIEEINQELYKRIFEPFAKKLRKKMTYVDTIGEPVAFTIHANKVKQKGTFCYDFGIDMTDTCGKNVFAVLPSTIPEVAKLQPKVNFEFRLF